MLGRKYDVVAANPPYMGSKNMRNFTSVTSNNTTPKANATCMRRSYSAATS